MFVFLVHSAKNLDAHIAVAAGGIRYSPGILENVQALMCRKWKTCITNLMDVNFNTTFDPYVVDHIAFADVQYIKSYIITCSGVVYFLVFSAHTTTLTCHLRPSIVMKFMTVVLRNPVSFCF
ncbi:hypothetical protein NPIL_455981 [Nephila pilipes]|uniref:Uncharacterized protein n=1 Tax=Nephila pilipes TaxID=299642 RepID=A0A8X6Q9M1_NEPPI|nr:hypothetical protein NPIL_701691 [Nephila pilipes]GFU14213.1 hypothetical protein NPIL_455981 [Nephila pilipes]